MVSVKKRKAMLVFDTGATKDDYYSDTFVFTWDKDSWKQSLDTIIDAMRKEQVYSDEACAYMCGMWIKQNLKHKFATISEMREYIDNEY